MSGFNESDLLLCKDPYSALPLFAENTTEIQS